MFLNAFRPHTALNDMSDLYKFFILIFILGLTYICFKENKQRAYFNWFNSFIIINAIVTIFQRLTGFGLLIVEGVPRPPGLMTHSNSTGFLVNIFLPLAVYCYIKAKTKTNKFFWLTGIILGILSLLLTFSKAAYLIFATQLGFLFLFLPLKNKVKFILSFISLSVIVILLDIVMGLSLAEYVVDRFNNQDSFEWRLKVWGYLMDNLKGAAIIAGNGINSSLYYLMQVNYGDSPFPHNLYIQMLYEYGLTGFFYIIGLIFAGIKLLNIYFNDKKIDRIFVLVPLLMIASILINMFSDNCMFLRTNMFIAWSSVTILYVMVIAESEKSKNEKIKNSISQ